MTTSVAVFGSGVAGLTAAHELACRGYQVKVYEAGSTIGGKARSQDVGHGASGTGRLPGEHGFRFFPFFYQNVVDSMARIPLDPDEVTVAHCMQAGSVTESSSRSHGDDRRSPRPSTRSWSICFILASIPRMQRSWCRE